MLCLTTLKVTLALLVAGASLVTAAPNMSPNDLGVAGMLEERQNCAGCPQPGAPCFNNCANRGCC